MKKSRIGGYVAIVIGIAIAVSIFSLDSSEKVDAVYHITLADPSLYENGVFTETFEIQRGSYQFRFTPNGDSPTILSVTLLGSSFSFSEDFELLGTLHDTSFSLYYTWDYIGTKEIQVIEEQELRIEVNPHDNILGPVSIDLMPLG